MFGRILLLNTPLLYVKLILFKVKKLMEGWYILANKYIVSLIPKLEKFGYFLGTSVFFLSLHFRKNPNFGKFGSKSKSLSKSCSKP